MIVIRPIQRDWSTGVLDELIVRHRCALDNSGKKCQVMAGMIAYKRHQVHSYL